MEFKSYFQTTIDRGASDLHLVVGAKPSLRIDGELSPIDDTIITEDFMGQALGVLLTEDRLRLFYENRELDFSADMFNHRFRINLHYQKGVVGLSARSIRMEVPTPEEVGFTPAISNLTRLRDGLILVTGPSGSGKSTTLATMMQMINNSRRAHVVTVEDPVEYIFNHQLCVVEQREVGSDTLSFATALKYVLRQDPNIIMVGEMRDTETIAAVLTAAETGHLVLSTLHTNSAPETIARIIDSFPSHRRQQILAQLSLTLRAVIAQQLLPRVGGGLVAVREVMVNNQAVSNLIRENKINQLPTVIKTNYQSGMIDMNKSVQLLFESGYIDEPTSIKYQRNTETKAMYI